MGFEPGVDRLKVSGMTEAGFRAGATQVSEHLHGGQVLEPFGQRPALSPATLARRRYSPTVEGETRRVRETARIDSPASKNSRRVV